jgi:hypothetical protein
MTLNKQPSFEQRNILKVMAEGFKPRYGPGCDREIMYPLLLLTNQKLCKHRPSNGFRTRASLSYDRNQLTPSTCFSSHYQRFRFLVCDSGNPHELWGTCGSFSLLLASRLKNNQNRAPQKPNSHLKGGKRSCVLHKLSQKKGGPWRASTGFQVRFAQQGNSQSPDSQRVNLADISA